MVQRSDNCYNIQMPSTMENCYLLLSGNLFLEISVDSGNTVFIFSYYDFRLSYENYTRIRSTMFICSNFYRLFAIFVVPVSCLYIDRLQLDLVNYHSHLWIFKFSPIIAFNSKNEVTRIDCHAIYKQF